MSAPIPYTPTPRVSGLRRIATVPNDDHELVYLAEPEPDGDMLCIEYRARLIRGRAVKCLVGARLVHYTPAAPADPQRCAARRGGRR